jgi:hypothetical protein
VPRLGTTRRKGAKREKRAHLCVFRVQSVERFADARVQPVFAQKVAEGLGGGGEAVRHLRASGVSGADASFVWEAGAHAAATRLYALRGQLPHHLAQRRVLAAFAPARRGASARGAG